MLGLMCILGCVQGCQGNEDTPITSDIACILIRSIVIGMAWMYALATPTGDVSLYIRHTCQHADNLGRYGWIKHDGRSFGQQEITDSCKKRFTCAHVLYVLYYCRSEAFN